jgi:dihydrofolate synthase/folylpolyglutamate synthase
LTNFIDPILLLLPKNAQYIFCQAAIPRALDAQILQNKAKEYGLNGVVVEDVNMAYAWAKSHAGPQDLILIGGSTFVVAELHDL